MVSCGCRAMEGRLFPDLQDENCAARGPRWSQSETEAGGESPSQSGDAGNTGE